MREVGFDEGPLWDAVELLITEGCLRGHVTTVTHQSITGSGKTVYVCSLPTGVYATLSTGERRLWDLVASVGSALPVRLRDLFNHIDADEARLVARVILAGLRVSTREIEGVSE